MNKRNKRNALLKQRNLPYTLTLGTKSLINLRMHQLQPLGVKTICSCGKKAIVNARIDSQCNVVTEGGQIMLGGNDSYVAMCHSCWMNAIQKQGK